MQRKNFTANIKREKVGEKSVKKRRSFPEKKPSKQKQKTVGFKTKRALLPQSLLCS